MTRYGLAGGIALCLLFGAAEARAQLVGTCRGKVVDVEGNPVPDAQVQFEHQKDATKKVPKNKTNKKGEFVQLVTSSGPWTIRIAKEGFQERLAKNLDVPMGGNLDLPTAIQLFPVGHGQAKAAAPTEQSMDKLVAEREAAQAKAFAELRDAFGKAVQLTQTGQLDLAEAAYKEILAKQPSIPEVHFNMGILYSMKKDLAAAEASFLKALELREDYIDVYLALTNVYLQGGQMPKAHELLTKAVAKHAGSASLHHNLGVVCFNSGKMDEAEVAFKKVMELDPADPEPYYYLGTIAVGQNKVTEAVRQLEKYLAMTPKNKQNIETAKGLIQALKSAR